MGDFPLMTESGTFVINGAERVIVSQLVRSPGVYYDMEYDKTGKELFASTVIPNRGAWLEYETDSNDVFYVRIDKNRKIPITVFIRAALGVMGSRRSEISLGLSSATDEPHLSATIGKRIATKTRRGGAAGGLPQAAPRRAADHRKRSQAHLDSLFFDARRYDLSRVGRYKYNKKLAIARPHCRAEAGAAGSRPADRRAAGRSRRDVNAAKKRDAD